MNLRNLGKGALGLILIGVVLYLKFGLGNAMSAAKIEQYAQETKQEFLTLIADSEVCQGDGKAYVTWLAESCHEHAWRDNHKLEHVSENRSDVVIDADGYTREMLTLMMDMATANNSPQVADGLGNLRVQLFPVE